MIRLDDIHKTFPQPREVHVLKGISLEVKPGEMVALVGASGVGKSTLLQIIGTLERPSSGSVEIDGRDVLPLSEDRLADFRNQTIGFVFQFHHLLFDFSAMENVAMPLRIARVPAGQARARALRLLEEVGLGNRAHHRPGELSGGEQQRVAVARAIANQPRILLADEPTGNLGSRASEYLFELLRRLSREQGLTLIVVTHNDRLAGRADRVLRMVDGRIED